MTIEEIVNRLREFGDFYMRRPSVINRTPTLFEITDGECRDVADQCIVAADRLEELEAENSKLKSQCAELIALFNEFIVEMKENNASLRSILGEKMDVGTENE